MAASMSEMVHRIAGAPEQSGCESREAFHCWICGVLATRGQPRTAWAGANFVGQNKARCVESMLVCEACVYVMAGRPPDTARMWTHLVEGDTHRRENKGGKPAIRAFLRAPHAAPWAAAIADSGQKHVIPWTPINVGGQAGGAVLFEESRVELPCDDDGWRLLDELTELLTGGATKEEILRGDYGPRAWELLGARLRTFEARRGAALRGGAWFELAVWLAQRDEVAVAERMAAEKETKNARRRRKGAAANPDGGGGARTARRVPRDAGVQRAQALDHTPGPHESGSAEQRERRGVGDADDAHAPTGGAYGEQLSLLPRPRRRGARVAK